MCISNIRPEPRDSSPRRSQGLLSRGEGLILLIHTEKPCYLYLTCTSMLPDIHSSILLFHLSFHSFVNNSSPTLLSSMQNPIKDVLHFLKNIFSQCTLEFSILPKNPYFINLFVIMYQLLFLSFSICFSSDLTLMKIFIYFSFG